MGVMKITLIDTGKRDKAFSEVDLKRHFIVVSSTLELLVTNFAWWQ